MAMPAQAAVLAGTTIMPRAGYEPLLGPAARSPGGQKRTSPGSRSIHFARSSRQCASRNATPVSSSRVSRAARDTTRSTGSPASSSPRRTAAAYGVPDAPVTPTTQGVRIPLSIARSRPEPEVPDEVDEREDEQGDAD